MSHNKNSVANNTEKTKEAPKPVAKQTEATYTVDEFASAPQSVGANTQDIIRAAFRVAGKESATIEEAKKIVKDFKERKVK